MSDLRVSKGMGMVEVMISLFIASVAIMAIFSLQSPAWRATAQADLIGRSSGILHRQLENTQAYIMNICNTAAYATSGIPAIPVVGDTTTATYDVRASGLGADTIGDATFNVTTRITGVTPIIFRVRVTVTWLANPTGITSTMIVSRQEYYRTGCSGT